MLVLSRSVGESIIVGEVTFRILEQRGKRIRIGIEAPIEMPIARDELLSDDPAMALRTETVTDRTRESA